MTATGKEFGLQPGLVYIRERSLRADVPELAEMRSVLSEDEARRADRFRLPRHRRRFIVAHATLRHVLGSLVDKKPQTLRFDYGEHGKPSLREGPSFNMSHSRERLILGVAREGRLGIDIEEVRPVRDMEGLAEKKFSTDEFELMMAAPDELRQTTFFRIWTRKEAYLKALGKGLSVSLASFSVNPGAGTGAGLIRTDDPAETLEEWSLAGLSCGEGAEAALAIDRRRATVVPLPS